DWGTQFGMIIYGYRHFLDADAYRSEPVAELGRVYRVVRQLMDYQDALEQLPRAEEQVARLQKQAADARQAALAAPQDKKLDKAAKKLSAQAAAASEERDGLRRTIAQVENDPQLKGLAREHPDIRQAVLRETAKLHAGDA